MIDIWQPQWSDLPPLAVTGLIEANSRGASFQSSAGVLAVEIFAEGVLRLRLGPQDLPDYGILDAEPDDLEATVGANGQWSVAGGALRAELGSEPFTLSLSKGNTTVLSSTTDGHFTRPHRLPPFARTETSWVVAFALQSDEPVYGLGEKWGALDRRGQLLRSWNQDALGVNGEASYKNCPFAWSPRGWGVFVHTPAPVTHGVGFAPWSHRSYVIEVEDQALDLFVIAGDTPAEILERFTHLTGRTPLPPLWSLGAWLSKAYYQDAAELLANARELRARRIPCDVITLDGRAWLHTRTRFAFEWDSSRYPDPKQVTDALHDLGLKLCCWEYPLVSVHHPLFEELDRRGLLLRDRETGQSLRYHFDPAPFGEVLTPLPDSGLPDFTNPEAYALWRDRHAALFESGIDVIKSDFGEQVPEQALAHNGDSGQRLHNAYALLYNRCVFEASERYGDGPGLVFGRAGWAGSQRFPVQWGGDPQSDWEALAASLRGALSWGLSGVPCYATDIGGYYGEQPDPDLFVRWTAAAVFSSHLRFHGIGPREPWSFGPEAEAIVRRFLELRYRLLPYIEGCLIEAVASGLPVMRAMVLAFPQHPECWAFDGQFLFGPDLLVAPVTRPDGTATVYLPPGEWYDYWTKERASGGQVLHLEVPLDEIPLFVRGGAILPFGPAVQHTGELPGGAIVEYLEAYGLPRHGPCWAQAPELEAPEDEAPEDGGRRLPLAPPLPECRTFGPVQAHAVADGIAFEPFDGEEEALP
jgi:alpha-D-xyloside xylohydrolase